VRNEALYRWISAVVGRGTTAIVSWSRPTWKLWSRAGDGDELARVDHADLDLLGSDHDAAAGGHAPLDRDQA